MTDPVRGLADLLPRLLGHAERRRPGLQPGQESKKERIGRILQMHANQREEIKEVLSGDIAAAVGLKDVTTGDTLCSQDHIITLERMIFPEPVISMAVEPKTKVDQEKMGIALGRLAQEDPSFRVRYRRGVRSDDHLRHGRAAPRDPRRPHEARVQRRSQRRQAAGRVPRDDPQARSSRKASSCASPVVVASTVTSSSRWSRRSVAPATCFENAIVGGVVPKEYVHGGRQGHPGSDEERRAGRLPGRGHQDPRRRRLVP